MLRNDDDLTSGAQAFFEQRARDTSEAMTFARRQQDETDAASDAEHQQQARDWVRSQALGDALPSPDDYDYPRMIREGVIPTKDGANRVPLPPQYFKPGRLLVNGVDLATGQRILSRVPLEDRVLGLAQDDDEEAADVRGILSQMSEMDLAELLPTQRRALDAWMEHHGIMVAAGPTATKTDAPPAERVGSPFAANADMRELGRPVAGLFDMLAGALKGGVAQTLGLPGDIESLVRLLTGGEQVMPTTEDMEGKLPAVIPPRTTDLVTGGDRLRQVPAEFGQGIGEVVGLGKAPGMAVKGVAAGAKALAPTAKEMARKGVETVVDSAGGRMRAVPDGGAMPTKLHEATGLPLNDDGTVTLYHHTNKAAADAIKKSGRLRSAGEPDVYLTTTQDATTGYGETVVAVRVDPKSLQLDDEFPDGRRDFRVSTGKPGGSIAVKVQK